MNKIIYIVEGQIEDKFFKQMRESDLFSPGKIFIFNLMQEKLKPSSNILTKKLDEVNAVIDTDIINEGNLENLYHNLRILKSIGNIKIWVQNENFEDELCYIMHCKNIAALGKLFKLKNTTLKGVKAYLSQDIRYREYISVNNIKYYCVRGEMFKEMFVKKYKLKGVVFKK